MSRTKEVVTAVGTLACALGIGFAMQSTDAAGKRYSLSPEASNTAQAPVKPEQAREDVVVEKMDVQDITLTSALSDAPAESPVVDEPLAQVANQASILPNPLKPRTAERKVTTAPCAIVTRATPVKQAHVNVSITADCLPNARVVISHAGLSFADVTDANGNLSIDVPALKKQAVVTFKFDTGESAMARATVEDLADHRRVVLQWQGDIGFELHALEFGAVYGEEGHVWRGSEAASTDDSTQFGTMTLLGDASLEQPRFAEVYTFPSDLIVGAAQVDMSVETQINTANCGQEIFAQTLELSPLGEVRTRDISLSVPSCDALGDYLVLNNVLEDLKLAAR